MKIVYVTDVVYPFIKGGAEKRVFELSRRMASRGHDVHVYSVKWWDGPAEFLSEGVTYHGVCRKRALYVNGRRSIAEALWFSLCLLGPLCRARFDLIDCNQHPYFPAFSCKIASMFRGGRLFVTWHEYWGPYWSEYLGAAGLFGRAIEKIVTALPDKIVAVSRRTAADLAADGVPGRKVLIVSNGIGLDRIRSVSPADTVTDVAYAGRLIGDKHVDVLLRACALGPANVRLAVFGEGPEKAALERLAADLGIGGRTEFGGFVEEDVLIARLKAAKLFVLPSTREGFSITTLEALACGLPVITVDSPRNHATDLIDRGVTGAVVDLGAEALSEAIGSLLADESRRSAMGAACVEAAARYDWGRLSLELEQAYLEKPARPD